jgi:DNA-binding phage protein
MNFRELVERERAYADPCRRPRTIGKMAAKCGISRPHIYNLFYGAKSPAPWTVAKIARGLGVEPEVVREALDRSRESARLVALGELLA